MIIEDRTNDGEINKFGKTLVPKNGDPIDST